MKNDNAILQVDKDVFILYLFKNSKIPSMTYNELHRKGEREKTHAAF